MTSLLVLKQNIKKFISKYEAYLLPLCKLALALISLILINGQLGYMSKITGITVVLVVALMCSFMPMNFIIIVSAAFVLLHVYELSLESAVVALAVFLILFLLYFRFSPKDTLVVLLTPICFLLKIPYVIPLSMGLLGTPASAVSVGCGVIVSYLITYISGSATALSGMESDDMASKFRYIIDGYIGNKGMIVTIVAFAVALVVVYLVRRLSIEHAWTAAMIAGALVNVMILLIGDLMFDTNVSILGVIFGTIVSILITKILEFFFFHLDYSRTENVQFEDDEYYYYVKAVPKITVAAPSRTVKKINSQRRKTSGTTQNRR